MNLRCQARMVSGCAIVAISCSACRPRCLFHKYAASHRRHAVGAQHAAPLLPEGSIDTLESCPEVAHCAPPPRGLYTGAGLTKWTSRRREEDPDAPYER